MKELLEDCIKKTEPEYYPSVEKNTVAGKLQRPKKRSWKSGCAAWKVSGSWGRERMIYQKLV